MKVVNKYGSLQELENKEEKERLEERPGLMAAYRKNLLEKLEAYDPNGKQAHELAGKYRKE